MQVYIVLKFSYQYCRIAISIAVDSKQGFGFISNMFDDQILIGFVAFNMF